MTRGGSSLGDKTLLDALVPAIDSLEASLADPATAADRGVAAIQKAADVAVKAAEDTKADDRHARPRRVHGRAEHRLRRRRGDGDRRDSPGRQRRMARQVRQVNRRVNA